MLLLLLLLLLLSHLQRQRENESKSLPSLLLSCKRELLTTNGIIAPYSHDNTMMETSPLKLSSSFSSQSKYFIIFFRRRTRIRIIRPGRNRFFFFFFFYLLLFRNRIRFRIPLLVHNYYNLLSVLNVLLMWMWMWMWMISVLNIVVVVIVIFDIPNNFSRIESATQEQEQQ